jgi:hypothetical protein
MAMTQPLENPEVRGTFEPIPFPPQQAPTEQGAAVPLEPDRQQEFIDAGGALFIESRDQAQQQAQVGQGEPATSSAAAPTETEEDGGGAPTESLFVSSHEVPKSKTQFINLRPEATYDDQ